MTTDIKAPTFPESVQEGSVATWHKQEGDAVERDELIVDIETDKVVLEVVAQTDGVIKKILKEEGATVQSQEVLGHLEEGKAAAGPEEKEAETSGSQDQSGSREESTPATTEEREQPKSGADAADEDKASKEQPPASPAARKLAAEKDIELADVEGSGKGGRITKEDVDRFQPPQKPAAEKPGSSAPAPELPESDREKVAAGERVEKRVPMTRMRKRIAERLLQVNQNTAMLTTFNEVDMHRIMNLRSRFKDLFAEVHGGTRLGFMGFFVKAAVEALKRFPAVNASIDGDDVVYHAYQDIGVAVSTEKGLVVPVLRDADQMSIADIEQNIVEYGRKAQSNKLSIEEMTGGTFTITNGGVFGSMLSTPILNPPQTAILGMHKIQDRPVVEEGEIVVRPMMYLALSYDHRLIDGKEAVQFLVAIKEMIENPAKILLEI